jgi:hypothetical protein
MLFDCTSVEFEPAVCFVFIGGKLLLLQFMSRYIAAA